jgi:hypothetical protein
MLFQSSDIVCFVFTCILFFLAVPGIVVCFPRNANKYKRAAVHAVLFGAVFMVGFKFCRQMMHRGPMFFEGFTPVSKTLSKKTAAPAN